jgi:hypothetical protein
VQFSESLAACVEAQIPNAEMGRAYVQFALDRPGLFRLMFSPLFQARAAHPDMEAAATKAFDLLGCNSADSVKGRARFPAISAWAEAHGLAQLMLDGVFPAENRDEILESVFGPRAA